MSTTVGEMWRTLAGIEHDGAATFKNLKFRVCATDGLAGKLLIWLEENIPNGATNGDAMEVLDAAKFWLTFIGATAERVVQAEGEGE